MAGFCLRRRGTIGQGNFDAIDNIKGLNGDKEKGSQAPLVGNSTK